MFVIVTIQLEAGEAFADSPDDAAQKVLDALGGDSATDTCQASITATSSTGTAGRALEDPPFA